MPPRLRLDPRDPRPLWRQIEEGVRHLVAAGVLRPEQLMTSVRELAAELEVNPATVARAYGRLTDAGVLTVRRGEGTFVAGAPPLATTAEIGARLREEALRYAALAATLGARRADAERALRAAWDELNRDRAKHATNGPKEDR